MHLRHNRHYRHIWYFSLARAEVSADYKLDRIGSRLRCDVDTQNPQAEVTLVGIALPIARAERAVRAYRHAAVGGQKRVERDDHAPERRRPKIGFADRPVAGGDLHRRIVVEVVARRLD